MALKADQKIEIWKLLIAAIFTVVGAFWTYTTYTENERNNELNTLIDLGDSIAGMNVTCLDEFDMLAKLADKSKDSQEGKCYEYWQDANRKSLSAMITVRKPLFCSHKTWVGYWNTLQEVINRVGSQKYSSESIDSAWDDILISKGLKEKPERRGGG